MKVTLPATPECDKLSAIQTERTAINDFIDWLRASEGVQLSTRVTITEEREHIWPSRREGETYLVELETDMPYNRNIDDAIMEFYGIDPKALERERRALLAAYQKTEPKP